jgi:radical SAM family RiPP maturation amino acid epimerase
MTVPAIGDTPARRSGAADHFSAAERAEITQVKCFIERYTADGKFRSALAETQNWFTDKSPLDVTREAGLAIDPKIIAPLWRGDRHKPLSPADYPTLVRYRVFMETLRSLSASRRMLGLTVASSPVFEHWRRRQILRTENELGQQATRGNPFPIVSFELSEGCSVGCWFCGFSAKKYVESFRYTSDNAALWRQVLRVLVNEFGSATQLGVCYWATDPLDNPDYEHFAEDYHQITGWLPSLTTALPVKNTERTRNLLNMRRELGGGVDRFSILTVKILDRVHRAFSAEELLFTQLVPQTPESLYYKKAAGKLHTPQMSGPSGPDVSAIRSGSIACGAGFLVNMVQRQVRLTSPCQVSDRWPLGYIIHAEGQFETAEEFRKLILSMIESVMGADLQPASILRLRQDLIVESADDGFVLKSPNATHTVKGDTSLHHFAKMLKDRTYRYRDAVKEMTSIGADAATVGQKIQDLFDHGFLCDDPATLAGRDLDCPARAPMEPWLRMQESSDQPNLNRSSANQPQSPGAEQNC